MLNIQGLYKSYQNGKETVPVLNGISLFVQDGEFVAIRGRSGCGKTTLLNVLGLINNFDEGLYQIDGYNTAHLTPDQRTSLRASKIGIVFQSFHLLPELNCLENVALPLGYAGVGKKEREQHAMEYLAEVGLTDKAKNTPSQLSGGQQQRVAIARALVRSPSLILADEPTGNLDYKNGVEIMRLLQKLNEDGKTVVMVTHDEEFARYANHICTMQDGVFQSIG